MNTRPPTLDQRIDEVEARLAQRQERLQWHWRETQRSARALMRFNRTLPLVAAGAATLLSCMLLRRSPQSASTGGLLGMLMAAGLSLVRPRYGALYSLAWQLWSRRRTPARRSRF